jgi:GNAT superfamily N-acetyltransferase
MKLTRRPCQNDADYWRIRDFLREVFLLNDRHELSWQVARLDYWRYFGNESFEHYRLEEVIHFWETPESRIIAVLNPEGRGNAYFQVHPAFRSLELEAEMLSVAEQYLPEPENGSRKLTIWAHQQDDLRQSVLKQCGYIQGDWPEYQRRRSLDIPIPEMPSATGIKVRALGDVDELPKRSWVSWRAFHPDEPEDKYIGWEWYHNIQRCPLYRRDLDLVVDAPNGDLAGFTTVWYDDVTRTGYFEPVGVAPEYQGRGIGKAMMLEGLRRLKRLGGTLATVAGYSQAANALYSSVMSKDYVLAERWEKVW